MNKVLVVGDMHLKPKLFDRAEKVLESGQADFAVQLGDLVDDWGEEFNLALYERTIRRAIDFHKKFPNTLWCMGNHDFGYYHPEYGKRCSGHSRFVEYPMGELLLEMKDAGIEQKIVRHIDNVIFSHAGLTEEWMSVVGLGGIENDTTGNCLENLVNNVEPGLLWRGDSPIWARPQDERMRLFSDRLQVVGHTPMEKITQEGDLLSTDVFSAYPSGAPIGEERFIIVDTKTKKWHYAKED